MFEQDEAYNENFQRLEKIIDETGYVFNPDKERINKVVGLMTKNFKEFGDYYCPCKQHHPLDMGADPLCPCEELNNEINENGHCICRLFYSTKEV